MRMTQHIALTLTLCGLEERCLRIAQTNWAVEKTMHIGGQGSWDYLTVDSATHRLVVPRSTHTLVIDCRIRKVTRRHSRPEDRSWRRCRSFSRARIHHRRRRQRRHRHLRP